MSDSHEDLSQRLRSCGVGLAILMVAMLFVFAPIAYFGYGKHGQAGLLAACTATFLCFASSGAALIVTAMMTGTPNALSGLLLGIVLRTAAPFLVSILLMQASKPLADAGLLGMVLINYFVALAVETLLAVRIVQTHSQTVVQQ